MNISAFQEGFSTFLIGVTIVFATLVLLIFIIKLLGYVVAKIEDTKKKTTPSVAAPVSAPQPQVVQAKALEDESELIAVITAVIAASMGTTTDKLQVRSLRQITR